MAWIFVKVCIRPIYLFARSQVSVVHAKTTTTPVDAFDVQNNFELPMVVGQNSNSAAMVVRQNNNSLPIV